MTKVLGDEIPFFSNLPAKAIEPAAKLWDACRAPDFNRMTAYADFIGELNDRKIPLPARSLFNRWVAGVQINKIARPGTASVASKPDASLLAYFANVPTDAVFALQAAWDRLETTLFSAQKNFEILCRDMNSVGHPAPERKEFSAWIDAIRNGDVARPVRGVSLAIPDEPKVSDQSEIEAAPEDLALAVKSQMERTLNRARPMKLNASAITAPLISPEPKTVTEAIPLDALIHQDAIATPALVAVKVAVSRLVEEIVVQLSAGIEHAARENAALMLRDLVNELEGGAVA